MLEKLAANENSPAEPCETSALLSLSLVLIVVCWSRVCLFQEAPFENKTGEKFITIIKTYL